MQVRKVGPDDARPVLFVHGTPTDSGPWSRVVERRPDDVCAWVVELPDHASDAPESTLASIEAELRELLEASARPWTVVGHSLGAYLSARAWTGVEPRVERAVLVGGLPGMNAEMEQGFRALIGALESGALALPAFLDDWVPTTMGAGGPPEEVAELRASLARWPAERVLRCLRRVLVMREPERWVAPHSVRCTVVHAEDDVSMPMAMGVELAARGSRSTLERLPAGGHFLQITEPEVIAALAYGIG